LPLHRPVQGFPDSIWLSSSFLSRTHGVGSSMAR
jgi:hypothetical protein